MQQKEKAEYVVESEEVEVEEEEPAHVVNSEEEEQQEEEPVRPTPKRQAIHRFKQIGSPTDFWPKGTFLHRQEQESKALLREAKEAECQKMQQQEKFVNVVDSEKEEVEEEEPVCPTPKKRATYRFKQLNNPYDLLPAKPLTARRADKNKKVMREAKQAEHQRCQQLHYKPFLDPNKFQFTDAKPSGSGAFDLTEFEIGDDSKPPTMSDVEKLSNTDFPQSNLIITLVSSITRLKWVSNLGTSMINLWHLLSLKASKKK